MFSYLRNKAEFDRIYMRIGLEDPKLKYYCQSKNPIALNCIKL